MTIFQNQVPVTTSLQSKNNRLEKSRKRPREKENNIDIVEPANKKKIKNIQTTHPMVKFSDIGGNEKVLKDVVNLLLHLKHPEVYTNLGILPPRGFLLHGPPGCGKTLLAHAIAGVTNNYIFIEKMHFSFLQRCIDFFSSLFFRN